MDAVAVGNGICVARAYRPPVVGIRRARWRAFPRACGAATGTGASQTAGRTQPERAVAMLCNPLWKPGEIAEQLASRKELVTNHAVADVATRLYYDPTTGSFKRGAGSDVKGAARRLATLFNQLDLTFYLYGMSCDEMLALLPKEFDRFRQVAA